MKKIKQQELNEILEKHRKYLDNEEGGERADLRRADLRNVDLRSVNLRRANLIYADLRKADLRNTNLRSADLIHANLSTADLSNADLRYADLRNVYLRNAVLSNTDLRNADLGNLIGYALLSTTFNSSSRKNNQLNYIVELDIATTGCYQGSLEELKTRVAETHKNNEVIRKRYEKAINFIEEMVEDYKNNGDLN